MGEGDPLPVLRQTGREIGVKWLVGARGETVGSVKPVEGQYELGQTSPWWIHRPGSGVASVLKDNEHRLPMAGWNVVLLQLFGSADLQDKCLIYVYMFTCSNWTVYMAYRI